MASVVNFLFSLIAGIVVVVQTASLCFSADSPIPRWMVLDDTSLRDARSRLEWTRRDNGHDVDWQRAGQLCGARSGNWRLPTTEELVSLYENSATVGARCGGAVCRTTGPFELTGDWFWSADSVGNDGSDGDELAWGVRLANGARTQSVKVAGDGSRALCVRSSPGSRAPASLPPGVSGGPTVTLPIDQSHAAVIFSWTHRGFSHPLARLEQLQGSIRWDRRELSRSAVQVSLPLEGLHSGDEHLDKRLRGRDFFDAAHYPTINFKSTEIGAKAGTDAFLLTGELTVHGITQPITLQARINKVVDVPGHAPWLGFDADGLLQRSAFGLGRYVPLVSDDIAIHISLEAHAED